MHCFLSGELTATEDSLDYFDVPISKEMQNTPEAQYFRNNKPVKYAAPYLINPPVLKETERICSITNQPYKTDILFEEYGFTEPVSLEALQDLKVNLDFCVNKVQPIWRNRVKTEKKEVIKN